MRLVLLLITALLMAACSSTRHSAPIVDRTNRADARNGVLAGPRQMDSQGYYVVKKGDTLFQISQDFGQQFRDLVAWNNLANANGIQVDQLLRVVPPVAASGVQAASVASGSGIEVRSLTAAPAVAGVSHKTGPRGDKQPYSDAVLAEMQKPEASAVAPAIMVANVTKAPEKPAEAPAAAVAANAEDAGVVWIWPAEGKIVGTFNERKKGIDISGKLGQAILAAGAGKVMYAGSGIRGYGNLVIVKHTNNLLSAYAHNKTILVKEGQTVEKGEKIAEMGNTDADAVKLHFEIRQQGKPVDPSKYLPGR